MVYIEGIETKLFGVFLTRKGLGDGAGGDIHTMKKPCPIISIHYKLYLTTWLTRLSGLPKLILTLPEEFYSTEYSYFFQGLF